MFHIRKLKNKNGSISIQVVNYVNRKTIVSKHIGTSQDMEELLVLEDLAKNWIQREVYEKSLFPQSTKKVLFVDYCECIAVTHSFAKSFFEACATACGFNHLDALLLDLAFMRLIEPASKLRTIELLKKYFNISYSQRIYGRIPKFIHYKKEIEKAAYKIAKDKFNEQYFYVLYDVTTLYYESFKSDDIRIPGFSKDNKLQQPQIVVGLLVTQSGFPLTYEIFPGNTFEGKTMLPVLENFIESHPEVKPIIVADAAMLSEERIKELSNKGFSYIVGARLANISNALIKSIHSYINKNEKLVTRCKTQHGYLICNFSQKRYNKDLFELNKSIAKAEKLVEQQSTGKRNNFIKKVTKERIELNKPLIEKRKMLLGIKGYCTNIKDAEIPSQKIIEMYRNLWQVEKSFRMTKSDLETRPIFHHKEEAIKSHVLICFVALIIEKYLELMTGMSYLKIKDLVWNIKDAHIKDTKTKEVFRFRTNLEKITQSSIVDFLKTHKIV